MPLTGDGECGRHHCPRSQCPDDTTHTKSFSASDTLWGASQSAAEGLTRNEFITEALDTWLAIPDSRTDATPEHDLGVRRNHTVRLHVPLQAALEEKAARLGATDSDCINAAMLQALPAAPETAPVGAVRVRAWHRPKKRPATHSEATRATAIAMVTQAHRTAPSVARELGVEEGAIYRWVSLYRNEHPTADPQQADAPAAEVDAAASPTPKPAAKTGKPSTARTEPPAPSPVAARKAPKVAAAVRAARAAGHKVTTASQLAVPAPPVFKAGPLVDCLHENFRGVKGVCPDCYQWIGGKR